MPNTDPVQVRPPSFSQSGQEIYDSIMWGIEPELLTANLPSLAEKYKDETPEQKKARAERYQKAFAEYDVGYAAYLADQESKVHTFKHNLISSLEHADSEQDQQQLNSLEAAFHSAA